MTNPIETALTATSVIATKRDGGELSTDQIKWFIDGYTAGEIPDYQASALTMAIFLNSMSESELVVWTEAMIDSGERYSFAGLDKPLVDKHSTGGVGDKVSLILCPLVAACGAVMPQVAGRGLGHTGGTIDKLESIPGWQARIDHKTFTNILEKTGAVIAAASDTLAPADRKLYALRDATSTVESIPLISSSIMSKKIASGTKALVLDLKVGRGAFMKNVDDARQLANTMIGIGTAAGVSTTALLTRMDQPLGKAVGNTLEVDESIETLKGGGPADLIEVIVALAEEMLSLANVKADPAKVLASGQAFEVWEEMISAQGGDLSAKRPTASVITEVTAPQTGWMADLDAMNVGLASMRLGAGRATKEDVIDHAAGIECLTKPGEKVEAKQPIFRLHSNDEAKIVIAEKLLADAVRFSDQKPVLPAIVVEKIQTSAK